MPPAVLRGHPEEGAKYLNAYIQYKSVPGKLVNKSPCQK